MTYQNLLCRFPINSILGFIIRTYKKVGYDSLRYARQPAKSKPQPPAVNLSALSAPSNAGRAPLRAQSIATSPFDPPWTMCFDDPFGLYSHTNPDVNKSFKYSKSPKLVSQKWVLVAYLESRWNICSRTPGEFAETPIESYRSVLLLVSMIRNI